MTRFYRSACLGVRFLSRLVVRVKIIGAENVPLTGGLIIAANHVSYFDPPVLGSFAPREVHFFAKRTLFHYPGFGAVIRALNAIPVSRDSIDREALENAVAVVGRGDCLVVFPEGHRSLSGVMLPFRWGLGMIAQRAGCPIVPVYIHGLNRVSRCLVGQERAAVVFGPPLPADWVKTLPPTREGYNQVIEAVKEHILQLRDRFLTG